MKETINLRLIALRRFNAVQYLYALIIKIMVKNSFSKRKVDNKSNNLSTKNSSMSFSQIEMPFPGKISVTHPKAR